MAGHYIDTVENSVTGRPVNGAVIRVYTIPSASGGAFIPIYNDEALTDPIDQTDAPLTSNQYGRFEFYTNLSEGCIETSYGGIVRDIRENIAFIGGTVDGDVTALQIRVDNHDAVLGLSSNATDLGTFTGTTIADNSDVKAALQALETGVEAAVAGGYTDEQARDAIGAALVAGAGVSVAVNDGANSITISALPLAITAQAGTSYTAVLGDANMYIQFSNASAITFTIPPNSSVAFPIGTVIEMEQAGAGALSVAAGAGVTINSRSADLTLAGQYAVAFVKKVATDTWTMNGDL